MDRHPKIRLHVDHPLGSGETVALGREQAHYLFGVMRREVGAVVGLFNGRDGEWAAEVTDAGKRGGQLACRAQVRPQRDPPDLWLLFAPIKKARTDFIVEKATELGAARILPVQTRHTNAERIRRDRLQAHAVDAAAQCGGTWVPTVADLQPLSCCLDDWPADRVLAFADEATVEAGAASPPTPGPAGRAAILIGPEGGFSAAERARLLALPQVRRVSLGPRVLRADTAAVAALTLWQAAHGDWG